MKDNITPQCPCLNCGKSLDRAGHAHASPSEGDISVCFYCGHVMIFKTDLTFREPTDAEVVDMAGNAELVKYVTIRKMAYERYNKTNG